MRRIIAAAGAAGALCVIAAGLAGCGKLGSLERPGPMFGSASSAPQRAPGQDPNRPVSTIDARDQNAIPGRDQPGGPDPVAPAPPRDPNAPTP